MARPPGVMRALEHAGAREVEHGYGRGGTEGVVEFTIPLSAEPGAAEFLREATGGAHAPVRMSETVLYHELP